MKTIATVAVLAAIVTTTAFAKSNVSKVIIYKNDRRLELIGNNNRIIKTYTVMLGRTPVGKKTQEGDNKTPEGTYTLDRKNPNSRYFKSIHVSYPSAMDTFKAELRGVEPGGDIMLHGYPNDLQEISDWLMAMGLDGLDEEVIRGSLPKYDWTNGCIAVTNDEIAEIYDQIDVPTKIVILP